MHIDIPKRLKEFRIHLNLSQAEFADKAGIEQVSVSQIERGRSKPSLETTIKILQAFPELNSNWFLHGQGGMTDTAKPIHTAPSPLQPVAESETEKELKRRVRWLEEQVELWQKIATSGVDLSKIATGTTGSFNLGNDVADKPSVYMVVSHYQELAA